MLSKKLVLVRRVEGSGHSRQERWWSVSERVGVGETG
jgi:hypothetical protein